TVSLLIASAAPALTAPPFWGASHAVVVGPGDPVLGQPNGPVRVGAVLPPQLVCSRVVDVQTLPVPRAAVLRDPLIGAPVTVVIEPATCSGDWRDGWLNFVVGSPGGADILDLSLVSLDGRPLA